MNNINLPYFDKDTSNILKGIALIMMFIHHFFTFPTWWGEGISYPLIARLSPFFCAPFRLCVPVFCFLTGYFYFYGKNKSFKYSLKKIADILISYWCIFFIIAMIAVLCVDYQYTLGNFVKECFALYRPTMCFCWYVNFYIAFMLILPFITKVMSKNIHVDLIITFIIIPYAIRLMEHFPSNDIVYEILVNLSPWFSIVLTGYIFASYNLFERIYKLNTKIIRNKILNIIAYLVIACVVPMGRWAEPTMTIAFRKFPSINVSMDVFYAPVFIYVVVNLCKAIDFKSIKFVLIQIGKYSLHMWFISCIFFNNCKAVFQPILYYPHNPVIVTIWGLVLCFVPSYILDIGIKRMQSIKNKILSV